ncbi:hypothetical protein BJX64DRAFT_199998 [Aspergillus heterothallicus]
MASVSTSHQGAIRRHVFKACEGCRQQKTRCSGESPCARCTKLSLPCIIRSVARQRRDTPREPAQNDGPNTLLVALRSVRIRNATTGKTAVYGPTSTIALLHLIARETQANPDPHMGPLHGVVDSDMSTSAFNYDPLLSQSHSYQCSLSLEGSLTPPLCMTAIPNDILQFFLQRYVVTAWKLLPIQSPTQLQDVYKLSYRALSGNCAPPLLYPILLYQLAMGSLSTVQGELSDMLTKECELFISAGGYLSDELELQLNILMAQYYSETGSFDKAYSMLGSIASRIYSAGLHLEPRTPAIEQLLRFLLGLESHLCLALGRRPLLRPNLTVPNEGQPADTDFIAGLFDISNSMLDATPDQKSTFDAVSHAIWCTHARLESYWKEQEPVLAFAHADPSGPRRMEEGLYLNTILYEYAIVANLKPFLLYLGYNHILDRNRKSPTLSSETEAHFTRTRQGDPRVENALTIILNSSKRIISLIAGICQRGTVAKDLPMNSFFLETACVALVAYGLWSGELTAVWESIDLGIQCLEQLQYQHVSAMRLAAVRATIEQSGLSRM